MTATIAPIDPIDPTLTQARVATESSARVIAGDLSYAIKAVLPAIAGKTENYVLQHVHITVRGGRLVAEATNRYVAAEDFIADVGGEFHTRIMLTSAQAVEVERALRGSHLDVTITRDAIIADDGTVWQQEDPDLRFPELLGLLTPAGITAQERVRIRPTWLMTLQPAKLRRPGEEREGVDMRFGGNGDQRVIYVQFSDHFRATIIQLH